MIASVAILVAYSRPKSMTTLIAAVLCGDERMAKLLRVFISSPGDVVPERRRAALVIEKLAKDYARFFEIKPCLWETEPMLASGHFQDAIVQPGDTDIVVLILWGRLGTPLPERTQSQEYRGIDGRAPVTGTEWEFESGLAAYKARGAPDLLAYKKGSPPKAEYRSDADLEELRSQLKKLDAFWRRHFVDQGEFRAAFAGFEGLDGFETKLDGDLRRLIERRIAALQAEPEKPASPMWVKGSPFRGLETYRFEHAPIFFGRSEATKTAVEHLVENAEAGRPFLLVLGASGAGKSSLAQAGIVPVLGVRGVVPVIGAWRRAVCRPGGHPGGPFMALAAALADDEALPEVLNGQEVAALARHLEAASADPSFPIVAALKAREQAARQKGDLLSFEETRLILVVDQLEELFTLGEVTPDQRKMFILCLKGLMDSRRVFVVATMRSDYWHRAAEVPFLVALAEGHGRLDLLPATQAEITEMIRRPAEVAGLSFEIDPRTEIRLDATLAEEASREPGALPLLSFLLDALYVKDVQGNQGTTLTYASMRALGGLKGAIAIRAEAAFTALPADAQLALPKVLRALVTVSRSGAEPTARAVSMARFADGSLERRIVESFLDPNVRLLVADGDGDGAHFRLAHEALITHWERAKRQISQDRDDLRIRAVVEEAESEWHGAKVHNKRIYLLRDPQLANAVDLARRWGDELESRVLAFVYASSQYARLRQRLTLAAAVVFAFVAVTASALGVFAYRAEQTANIERASANERRDQALKTQSQFLAAQANLKTEQSDPVSATLLALEALPGGNVAERPLVPEAEVALYRGLGITHEVAVLGGFSDSTWGSSFSPDGQSILVPSSDGTARIFDGTTGRLKAVLQGHEFALSSGKFSSDGSRVITASVDHTARIWDAATGATIAILTGHLAAVDRAVFTPDDRLVVTGSRDGTTKIWDAGSGELLHTLMHSENRFGVEEVAVSADGKKIVTASGDGHARVWDLQTGKQIALLGGHNSDLYTARFSSDGTRVITSGDHTAQLWDALSGANQAVLWTKGFLWSAEFSPDDQTILTAEEGGLARLWDSKTGKVLVNYSGHTADVRSAHFSRDGQYVATASADGSARIWDKESGKNIAILRGHAREVSDASFSPDGKRVVTDSGDHTSRLWMILSNPWKRTLAETSDHTKVNFSPDGKLIAIAKWNGVVDIQEVESGRSLGKLKHSTAVTSATFSPDGTRIVSTTMATGESSNLTRVWKVANQTIQAAFDLQPERRDYSIRFASFSPDGKLVVSASAEGKARIWNSETGQLVRELVGHKQTVNTAQFSPNGQRIITAGNDSDAIIWDVKTGVSLGVLKHDDNGVSSAEFSADGTRIVTSSDDGIARIWDAKTLAQLASLIGHSKGVTRARFNADGTRVVTASADGTVRVWDIGSNKTIAILTGYKGQVLDAAFSPDGQHVVAASSGGSVTLSRVVPTTTMIVQEAIQSVPRCLTPAQRVDGFLDSAPPEWCIERKKWPYDTQDWDNWLAYKHLKTNPPLPYAPEWRDWVAARKAN